jgi:hypothetical protein
MGYMGNGQAEYRSSALIIFITIIAVAVSLLGIIVAFFE